MVAVRAEPDPLYGRVPDSGPGEGPSPWPRAVPSAVSAGVVPNGRSDRARRTTVRGCSALNLPSPAQKSDRKLHMRRRYTITYPRRSKQPTKGSEGV